MNKYFFLFLMITFPFILNSQINSEELMKIEKIKSLPKGKGAISNHDFGFMAFDSFNNIIKFCSYYVDREYLISDMDSLFLSVKYADMNQRNPDQKEVSKLIIDSIFNKFNLAISDTDERKDAIKIEFDFFDIIPSKDENPSYAKKDIKIESKMDFFIIQLSNYLGVRIIMPAWKYRTKKKYVIEFSSKEIQEVYGDVEKVKELFSKYKIVSEITKIPIIRISK